VLVTVSDLVSSGTSHRGDWKDTINNAPSTTTQDHPPVEPLHGDCLPQDVDNVSVCNLASINLSMH
jgi:hypothetical protein